MLLDSGVGEGGSGKSDAEGTRCPTYISRVLPKFADEVTTTFLSLPWRQVQRWLLR